MYKNSILQGQMP